MASPRLRASPIPPGAARSPAPRVPEAFTPANGGSLLKDQAIWKRLREAGFDEETVKRRDKAALIAYITKLESEIYDYQCNMGLLILEKQEWTSKFEQAKASAASAESVYKRDQAAHLSALAEARKREESLKKALGIEKECVANIEKALHDMCVESAETKLAYESKLAEARIMVETAEKKFDEAESKLRSAESLHAEASRCRNTALRNLQDVEAREDELRRRLISFQSECDAKEKELNLERQSLYDSQRILHQEQERLLEGQTLLNQRDEYIFERSRELSRFEKELEEAKTKFEEECRALKERKSNLDLDKAALATREEAVIKRESLLDRRERELLILQEKISSKEYDEIQRLSDERQSALERKKCEFEAQVEERCKLFEDEMEARRTACVDREAELNERENLIKERENSIELRLSALSGNQEDLAKKWKLLEEKEQNLHSTEKSAEMEMLNLQNEREEIRKMQVELDKIKGSLEDEKKAVFHAQEKLEVTIRERNELLVLETKLKEEIDSFRAKKMDLDAEADKLRSEKEKFETEWELIDEKREELQKEAERVVEERKAVGMFLRNEHDCIRIEKDNLRNQFKNDVESLSREQEEFISRMEHEHSDWLTKIQREREDFVKDIGIQRRELESCIDKRREEVETYLREKEEAFEQERAKELQHINSQKEMIAKELEHVALELKRLDNERMEIALDRDQREREWSEIKSSIEVLNIQREKLQKQRELLHADREEIYQKIQHLNKLEHLNIESENRALFEIHPHQLQSSKWKFPVKKCLNTSIDAQSIDIHDEQKLTVDSGFEPEMLLEKPSDDASPPIAATMSWVRKCAGAIFKLSPEKVVGATYEKNVESKISTKLGESSVANEFRSPKSNSFENKKPGDDKKITLSKLEYIEDPSVVSGKMKSNARGTRGRKETLSVRSDLENSYVILNVPPSDENVASVPDVELKSNKDKIITQLKEDAAKDMITESSRSTHSGVNMLLYGRKRLNNSLSNDHAEFELAQKHQKKARQEENTAVEEKSPMCILSTQMPYSDDECGLMSMNQTLGCKEISVCCTDKEHQIPNVSNLKPPEISQNASSLHCGILENGRSHESESHEPEKSSLVGNGTLLSSSCFVGMRKTQEQVTDKALLETVGANDITVSATELIADNSDKSEEQDGYNQVNDDRVEEDEEGSGDEDDAEEVNVSRLDKIWSFLTM